MEVVNIFDEKFHQIIRNEVKNVLLEGNEISDTEEVPKREWIPDKPNTLSCSFCRASFENFTQHREHYKLDWHRYNLRQSLLHKSPITENEFDEKNNKDDISSISGSDSEKEDTLDTYATAQGKIFLQNDEGKVFSVYACLLYNKKKKLNDEKISIRDDLDLYCRHFKKWAILMLGGGHFAGAIFDGDVPILHKTFHCYTVRAGQGGSQSARDNKSGGSHPKSAGASLRRYNEQSFVQHIKNIIEAWKTELQKCSLILYRASGAYNRSVLFGGSVPLLDRNGKELRTIPFSTRRATFAEVKRVHQKLATAHVYDSLESAIDHFSNQRLPEQNAKRNKLRSVSINRAKSRELVERLLPNIQASDSSDTSVEMNLSMNAELVNFEDTLLEFQDTLTPEQRQLIKKKRSKKSKSKKLKDREEQRKKELREMIITSDLEKLTKMIEEFVKKNEENNISSNILDEVIDDEGNTFLHVASINQKIEMVRFLLENNVNLCVKNEKQQTPYTCTQNKDIREMFKQFARDNPEKYNYNKAQIPTNILTPEEIMEKKKAQRKIKKEKEKVKKEELKIKKLEESEKERFLHLSDREKRALAAERRILTQSGVVIARCFLCASDMSGKVPFEYLGNRFCTIDCLKAHRLQNPIILSG